MHDIYFNALDVVFTFFTQKVTIFCQQSIWIGLMTTVPMIALILNAGHFFKLIGQSEDVIEAAER